MLQEQGDEIDEVEAPEVNYLGVYAVTRHYGGPEEGGWWYDWYEHVASCVLLPSQREHRDEIASELRKHYAALKTSRSKQGRFSVLGGADLEILNEAEPGEYATTERPHYS